MAKNSLKVIGCVLLMTVVCSSSVWAAGFALYEWSASGNAQANAVVARGDSVSTVANNPAGMINLEGTQVMAGATFIYPRGKVGITTGTQTFEPVENRPEPGLPPYFYATQKIGDRFALGLGIYSRFGLATKYANNWPGRYSEYYASVSSVSFTPEVAVKIMDGLSFGAGIEIMYLEFEQKALARTLLPLVTASEDIPAQLKADSLGFGGNASILYEPVDWISLGFMWRSQIKHVLKGSAKYDKTGKPAANAAGIYEDSDAHGNLMLPQSFTGGVALKPIENLVVEFDATWTGWSSYEEFKVIYKKNPYNNSVDATDIAVKDWKDVWQFNVGLEYGLTEWMDVRLGYAYDFSPQRDEHLAYSLPTGDRQWFAGGLGFHDDNWRLDASYTYLISAARDGNILVSDSAVFGSPQTTYTSEFKDTYAHLIGLSLGYKF